MSFKASLSRGQVGEILYMNAHNGKLEQLDGFKSDFKVIETGELVELKTDYYSMEKTPNFFFERFSDVDKKKPGGPHQAILNGSSLFVYFYVKDLVFFEFNTEKLIKVLDELIPSLRPTDVKNTSYVTRGYLVPRAKIIDIAVERKIKLYVE